MYAFRTVLPFEVHDNIFFIHREAVVSVKMFKIRKAKDDEPTAPGQGK